MSAIEDMLRAAACGTLNEVQAATAITGVHAHNEDGVNGLMTASAAGNFEVVRWFLGEGVDVDAKDRAGFTALIAASVRGQVAVVKLLAQHAQPNITTHNQLAAIHLAVRNNQLRTVRILAAIPTLNLNLPNQHGRTAFHSAVVEGFLPIVRFLVKHPRVDTKAVDKEGFNALHLAAGAHQTSVVTFLESVGFDLNARCGRLTTAMFIACAVGCLDVVKNLFDRTPLCVDADGDSELHVAVRFPRVLEYLLERKKHSLETITNDGSTALHRAVHEDMGSLEAVKLLVNAKAPLDVRDQFACTPFFKACHHGDVKMVRLLLKAKSDPFVLDQDGFTAMHAAAQKGCVSVLKYLASDVGLSLEAQNPRGYTPLMCALRFSKIKAAKWFVSHGVDLRLRSQLGTAIDVAKMFEDSCPEGKRLCEWLTRPCGRQSCSERGSKKCAGCCTTRYCSTACQRLHWNEHAPMCFLSL
jgi:ankyrin repeat protein